MDDHNDGVSEGIGPSPQNVVDGIRVSTAIGYLRPADGRPNLHIIGNAYAHHIVIERDRATAVAYSPSGGTPGTLEQARGRHIVVCAGALNTPALLMRSGIGPVRDLEAVGIRSTADLPGVGANLMEHVGAFVFVVPPEGAVTTDMVQHQLLIRYSSPNSPVTNDMQIGMMNHWDLSDNPALAEVCGSELIWGICAGIQTPRSRGRLRVLSPDPDHPPVIDLNLLDHPDDTAQLADGLRLCHRLATHEALAERFERIAVHDEAAFTDSDDTRPSRLCPPVQLPLVPRRRHRPNGSRPRQRRCGGRPRPSPRHRPPLGVRRLHPAGHPPSQHQPHLHRGGRTSRRTAAMMVRTPPPSKGAP